MSDALYERYKEALRAGHVATIKGRNEAALAAYVEAATLAPERALPHVSIGQVYLKMGRPTEALAAFTAGLDRNRDDEAGLIGRADALVALGRRSEAADALDRASAVQLAAGRTRASLTSACQALDLAESRPRRQAVEGLVGRMSAGPTPEDAEVLDLARRLLESRIYGPDEEAPAPPAPPPDPFALLAEAEGATYAGRPADARTALLGAARAFASTERPVAALDACYTALAITPDDAELHLELATLYLDRGWRPVAGDKLALLGRLAELDGREDILEQVRSIARQRLPDDPRLAGLLA